MSGFVEFSRLIIIKLFRNGLFFFNRFPFFRKSILAVIHCLGLYTLASRFYWRLNSVANHSNMRSQYFIPTELSHLSPRARLIFLELKSAIDSSQKEIV